jgi:cytochrome P450
MRILYEEQGCSVCLDENQAAKPPESTTDLSIPNLSFLQDNPELALKSFYVTMKRLMEENPVDIAQLTELAGKAKTGSLSEQEAEQLEALTLAATRQGKAVGAGYGFFFRYKPYPMLAEIRAKEKLFQPPFGPIIVAHGDTVLDVLTRHHEFTVDPYGREMIKSLTPNNNDGFDTFILSTDDDSKYLEDKALLTAVVNRNDPEKITELIHQDCMTRIRKAVQEARISGKLCVDIVPTVARFVPVTMGHHYLGVPAAEQMGKFELTDEMLEYYGDKVPGPDGKTPLPTSYQKPDGETISLPDSALTRGDGIIPDEAQIYLWIKASFRNFFNNVKKDIPVQAYGVRAYRELLAYIHREIKIQSQALQSGEMVPDNMLTRLLKLQQNIATPGVTRPAALDLARVSDLRIAENIMGTIVGAIAGQEEATSRVIDSVIRLQDGDYEQGDSNSLPDGQRYGSFAEAKELAINVLEQRDVENSRNELRKYALEALRLQPQGEALLRECVKDGATIADSRPIRAGTLIFASHASAMQDVDQPNAFIVGREDKHYLQHGYKRHKCLGQYVSPVLMVEALIAVLALENVRRPPSNPGESTFPSERRFGRLQLDDNNLYAETFTLEFDGYGTTSKYFGE